MIPWKVWWNTVAEESHCYLNQPGEIVSPQGSGLEWETQAAALLRRGCIVSLGPGAPPRPGHDPCPTHHQPIAFQFWSSGTSGPPQPVLYTHEQVASACDWFIHRFEITPEDTAAITLPPQLLFQRMLILVAQRRGCSLYFQKTRHHSVQIIVPSQITQTLPSRVVICGGAPIRGAPSWVTQAYAQTQCLIPIALNGQPQVDVTLDDGEIVIQSPWLAQGLSSPHRTGDLGEWDSSGRLHVMGRLSGLIKLPNGRWWNPYNLEVEYQGRACLWQGEVVWLGPTCPPDKAIVRHVPCTLSPKPTRQEIVNLLQLHT